MVEIPKGLQAALTDRYTIERELGRGGMATVYPAQDLQHERWLALRVLHPELRRPLVLSGFSSRALMGLVLWYWTAKRVRP